ncbi:MAG: hypothetical protein LBM39_00460 [Candidatus Methanoplasma sp.]|jgi:hypothetical protein|nr:hypothetical protein [Candidatus Methanoplasma sp.]
MNKKNIKTIGLPKGEVEVYWIGDAKLHAYKTNDPMTDEVFILEKYGHALIIEAPCFKDNIKELSDYICNLSVRVEAMFLSYHMAGGTFFPSVPVYATKNADVFGHSGKGKEMVDEFTGAFGKAFDSSIHKVKTVIDAGSIKSAGFTMVIVPTKDAFDIEIPEIGAVYIHSMGHDVHSIVPSTGEADCQIAQLRSIIVRRIDMILTSHHTPENSENARTKVEYLETLKKVAGTSKDAAAFKRTMKLKYPGYSGENYLDMTAGMLFPK